MRKSGKSFIITVLILCAALFPTFVLVSDNVAHRIWQVAVIGTGIIGAVALYLQFKREKDINEASLLKDFWHMFSEKRNLIELQLKCDADISAEKSTMTDEDYFAILDYAQWLEALCAVINRDILSFDFIDDMYNYVFFVFVNNKHIQNNALLPYIGYYKGICKYLKKHGKKVLLEENDLLKAIEDYKAKQK